MRFVEITGGFLAPISNEETVILEKIKGSNGPLPKASLTEREQEVARGMVTRGLLTRIKIEDKLYFLPNDLEELWES